MSKKKKKKRAEKEILNDCVCVVVENPKYSVWVSNEDLLDVNATLTNTSSNNTIVYEVKLELLCTLPNVETEI